ncbi:MAG: DUF4410 domain-containing protein [Verrucomicrobiota bacterium]
MNSNIYQTSNPLRLVLDTAALQLIRMKTITGKLMLVLAAVHFCGYAKAQDSNLVVYVADFEIDAANVKTDKAAPPAPPKAPGLLGKVLPPPPGAKKDPQDLARELVELMSTSIVKDLNQAGLTARRVATGDPLPTAGWLVRGVFTNVNQGNQLERAMVGFGKGKTDVQVLVDIAVLAQGTATNQLTEVKIAASSGKTPGSAPMIERHPAAVAARFVMAGNDLSKNVKQTASSIAEEVVQRCQR